MSSDLAHLSDEALIARSDDLALGELYDRHGRAAYGLALRVVKDPLLAEDVVQEAFLGVWRLTGALVPGRAQASTLIMTIVHRRAVDLVRREQRHRAAPLASAPHPATDSTEEATELRLQREHVQAALRQLPDEHRKPIELAYYGGLTQSEVANWLGQPLGTIKSRMFAGLARLRKLMENVASPERPGSSHERSS